MTEAGLVPAGPGAVRRELRRPVLPPARPMALGGAVVVADRQRDAGRHVLGRGLMGLLAAGDAWTADEPVAAVRFIGRLGRAALV